MRRIAKNKLSYWEERQIEDFFSYMQDAEKKAKEIAKIYSKACQYIILHSDKIFNRYQKKHNLTEAEAIELLNLMQDKTSVTQLILKLNQESGKEEKRRLLAELEAPAYQARLERLKDLQKQIDFIMKRVYQQEKKISAEFYTNLGKKSYYRSIYRIQQRIGIGFNFNNIDQKQIENILNSKWAGRNYSGSIWKNTKTLAQILKEELLLNLITGKTNREAAESIALKFAQGSSNARRLIRTESNYVSTELNFKSYQECGIEEYRFLATLDLKTSKVCQKLDNKTFPVKDRKTGKNCPPMHPWCRSTTIAAINKEYISKMKRAARDPKTGKYVLVSANLTYKEWYKKYVTNPSAA